jgi:arylsulfatase A-like enzyme
VRGHLPIATGGRTITWGSLLAELESRYTGPTLVGELKARGYATALVSAQGLDFEGLGAFYRGQPFDALFEPDAFDRDEDDEPALEHRTEGRPVDAPSALVPLSERAAVRAKRLNAWGIDERYALQVALDWIGRVARPSAAKRPAPFFLQFLTSATHHPYVSPPDVPRKRSETSRRDVYLDALSFSDSVVGALLDALGTRGLLEETIVAVVGDHGQAFGDVHPRNLGHKSFLYEDNVRNFMLLSDARSIPAYQRSSQIAFLGDVAPTLLRLAGHATAPSMPGRDLLARGYREGVRFFHKVAPPASWGLVDGSWKFVSPQIEGAGAPELYDLDADPDEQHNLAAAHPKRIALYACLCSVWYARTNDEFLDHLRGFAYRPTRRMRAEDVTTPGPKSLLFGLRAGDGRFTRRGRFHPLEEVVAFVEWLPLERDAHFEGAWVSPRGLVHKTPMHIDGSWSRSWHPFDGKSPLEPGEWRFEVRIRWAAPSARPIIASSFRVDPSVPLDAVRAESLRGLSIVARDASPERVRIGVTWGGGDPRTPQAALLEVEILGENARSFRAEVLATEPPTHASLWPDPPLGAGRYRVRVRSKGKTLAETAVRVSKPAVVSTTR